MADPTDPPEPEPFESRRETAPASANVETEPSDDEIDGPDVRGSL